MPIKYFVSKVGVFMDDVCCLDVDVLFLGRSWFRKDKWTDTENKGSSEDM